ncbi:MarR family transcriptional regulator [uncultured Sphingomonas sp.]|uniref:MarR family winged helix-turn-helix transcriptional regulator n=1 Tax=uncultured Sphingomonas sp. TaxID=158754 RepID=UPI0026364C6C|nr:MarR family transcriptional regulator [uncultured Sphingomonas sp.]
MKSSDVLLRDLARVYLMAHRLTDRAMTAQGASFSRTRLLLLIQAGNGRARAADIAEVFTMAPRSVTDAVDGLERDGLVQRMPDPEDRRVKRLRITPAGERAILASEPMRVALTERLFVAFDDDDREKLDSLLQKLLAALVAEMPDHLGAGACSLAAKGPDGGA